MENNTFIKTEVITIKKQIVVYILFLFFILYPTNKILAKNADIKKFLEEYDNLKTKLEEEQ